MDLSEYRAQYYGFIESTAKARVVTLLAVDSYRRLPEQLPELTRAGFEDLSWLLRRAAESLASPPPPPIEPERQLHADLPANDPFLTPAFLVIVSRVLRGENRADLDATPMTAGLEAAHYIAALGAFLGDTLHAICLRQPQQLARDRQISWKKVVGAGSWDAVLDTLIDESVQELGMLSLGKTLALLEKRCGLAFDIPDDDLVFLEEAEERRHLLLHNGGRVNRRYAKRFPACGIPLHAIVPFTPDYTQRLLSCVQRAGSSVFGATATKFFGATQSDHQLRVERPSAPDV